MIGRSPALTKVMETVRTAALYDSAVLIQGETGTGKELVARAIHFNSTRKTEPMITVNCAAVPEICADCGEAYMKTMSSVKSKGSSTALRNCIPRC